jgi:hypothetical protein
MNRRAMPKKLGKKMKQIREGLGMSQREIVKALNYKYTHCEHLKSRNTAKQREPTTMLVLAYARPAIC